MKKISISIILFCIVIINNAQSRDSVSINNPVIQFDYNPTQVFIYYSDLKKIIRPDNLLFFDLEENLLQKDTIKFDRSSYFNDTLDFDFGKEMYESIELKIAKVYHKNNLVSNIYSKKIIKRRLFKKIFEAIEYRDLNTDELLLIKIIYRSRIHGHARF